MNTALKAAGNTVHHIDNDNITKTITKMARINCNPKRITRLLFSHSNQSFLLHLSMSLFPSRYFHYPSSFRLKT